MGLGQPGCTHHVKNLPPAHHGPGIRGQQAHAHITWYVCGALNGHFCCSLHQGTSTSCVRMCEMTLGGHLQSVCTMDLLGAWMSPGPDCPSLCLCQLTTPYARASCGSLPCSSAPSMPATNESPAPLQLTARAGSASRCTTCMAIQPPAAVAAAAGPPAPSGCSIDSSAAPLAPSVSTMFLTPALYPDTTRALHSG
jgi:hypothetical protein